MNVDEIIRALRCINEAPPTEHNCSECSYGLVKRLPFTLRMKADFWRDYEPYLYCCDDERTQTDAIEALEMMEWIPCDKQMPTETQSSFAELFATDAWRDFMWLSGSPNVLVTAEYKNGDRIVFPCSTHDGIWNRTQIPMNSWFVRVVAWMPYPLPYGD